MSQSNEECPNHPGFPDCRCPPWQRKPRRIPHGPALTTEELEQRLATLVLLYGNDNDGHAAALTELCARLRRAEEENADLLDQLGRTCESPPDGCQCAGCLAMREHADGENAALQNEEG